MGRTATELRAMLGALTYPANQRYDPETLAPEGITRERVRLLATNAPELLEGGGSLLDLGSSKGFIALHLRNRYTRIDGYELGRHAAEAAEAVRRFHHLDHVRFLNRSFRQIEISKWMGPRYDVVYAGSVHHHFVKDAILHRAPMWLPLAKMAALCRRYLILDGPLEFGNDFSLTTWEREHGWPDEVRQAYTFDAHVQALAPQFELVRGPLPNERGRQCAVFERVLPDVRVWGMDEDLEQKLRADGAAIASNKAREVDSVVRFGDVRFKFDWGVQCGPVLGVLNKFPERFAHTRALLMRDGRAIGDLAEWVDGKPIRDGKQMVRPWLELNDALACIGLVEIHFKVGDFLRVGDRVVDVDFDMINHVSRIESAAGYLAKWQVAARRFFPAGMAEGIAENLADEWVFRKALDRLPEDWQ